MMFALATLFLINNPWPRPFLHASKQESDVQSHHRKKGDLMSSCAIHGGIPHVLSLRGLVENCFRTLD